MPANHRKLLPVKELHKKLLAWFDRAKRDLPWRHTRDPYAIWLSETMLQQTQVETVKPYWHRFLERFPDVRALASADLQEVLAAWAGFATFALIWRADWTWTEDWDLFSGITPLIVLLVARWMMPAPGVIRLPARLVVQVCLFGCLLAFSQHYYHHTRAAYLGTNGQIVSDDRVNGRLIQLFQYQNGFLYGDSDQVKDGVVRRTRTGGSSPTDGAIRRLPN